MEKLQVSTVRSATVAELENLTNQCCSGKSNVRVLSLTSPPVYLRGVWSIQYTFSPYRLPLSSPYHQENAILTRLIYSCLSIAFRHRSVIGFPKTRHEGPMAAVAHISQHSPVFRNHQKAQFIVIPSDHGAVGLF